jgi:hypothetical protein
MEVSEKLQKTKKLGKIFKIVSIAASVLAVFFVVFYCLAPATRLTTDIGKYAKGYNYYGWLIFLGCGYPPLKILCLFEEKSTIAGDYVPNTWDFDFNFGLFLGFILPIIAVIVCAIVSLKMKNRGKAVCEFVSAGAILLVCCAPLSALTATDMGAGVGFKNQYLIPAMEADTYNTLFYPVFTFVMCFLIAAFKGFRGAFLLYQRKLYKTAKAAAAN